LAIRRVLGRFVGSDRCLSGTRLVAAEFNEVMQKLVALQDGLKVYLLCQSVLFFL
jgi:hypothetical protein